MRVYIAYKYKAVQDKELLKDELQQISDALQRKGHVPFLLGRDIHKWHLLPHSSSKPTLVTAFHIVFNIFKSDVIFAYISSEVQSHGLSFEMFCAKLLNKPVIAATKVGLVLDPSIPGPITAISFSDVHDLSTQIDGLKQDLTK